jgi:HEAT repeat protein
MNLNKEMALLAVQLRSKNGVQRQRARTGLVKIGKPAIPLLINLLSDADDHVRWEACKTLGSIKDADAGSALVKSLSDEDEDVRWVAAEALCAVGHAAVVPLLQALEMHCESLFLRQGAHHVLRTLKRRHQLTEKTQAVLDTLRYLEPSVSVATAAQAALASLRKTER